VDQSTAMTGPREPTPARLAIVTIWTEADWQEVYDAWSDRPEWPALARYLVAAGWHPRLWRRLNVSLTALSRSAESDHGEESSP